MDTEQCERFTQAVTGTFMWSFKKGDNIVYNFDIIWELYIARSTAGSPIRMGKYNKPIILLQMSIVECILDDFVNRVGQYVHDQIPNITPSQINDFKTKKRDKLEHYISAAKKHNLFDQPDSFYDDMDLLRQARNRFHIQNTKRIEPANESRLFTAALLQKSEKVFETILEKMMSKFFRGTGQPMQYSNVPLPWQPSTHTPMAENHNDDIWQCVGCGNLYPASLAFCISCALPRP